MGPVAFVGDLPRSATSTAAGGARVFEMCCLVRGLPGPWVHGCVLGMASSSGQPVVKNRRAAELIAFAVDQLDESRSLRAGMLQLATDESGPSRQLAKRLFKAADAKAEAHSDWLLDAAARRSAGFKKLLRGWHDAAALAGVDSWPLDRYDLVQHPTAITKVDHALAELAQRFPERYALLRAACETADLPPPLYSASPSGDEN